MSKLPASPSVFNQSKRKKFADVIFLKNFIHDLSKPIDRDGKVHIDYVPTQIVTEFFRYMFNRKVAGIIYPSSRNTGNNAMVLFYDHYDCRRQLNFLPQSLQTRSIRSYRP
ncbi:RES family NAD+ phosphorylase [Niabella hibiscisoli]|uniref:RES family NAD+ phosphorylase n=1 Tax=Niabella hibiscisoli TaxID=1825928 RepID=UPI00374D317C